MKFVQPSVIKGEKVDWMISERTRLIVSYYAKYCMKSESTVVDEFLDNILLDKNFTEWLNKRRSKKKIENIILCDTKEVKEASND